MAGQHRNLYRCSTWRTDHRISVVLQNNLIYGLPPVILHWSMHDLSLFIGLVVGIMAYRIYENIPKALLTACAGGLAAVVVSTTLNILFWGGKNWKCMG